MTIERDSVVSIDYVLTDERGEVLDSSKEHGQPLLYIHGAGNIISRSSKGNTRGTGPRTSSLAWALALRAELNRGGSLW